MKILILLAPSEGKNGGGEHKTEDLSYAFDKPIDIALKATEKDLKCIGKRYEEGINLNKNLESGPFLESIHRYSGVVFNAISYLDMSSQGREYFENNVAIISGIYGLVKPLDKIGNYKLPIESKGLYKFWGDKIATKIGEIDSDYVINLLPDSYAKLVGIGKCSKLKIIRDKYVNGKTKIINIKFLIKKNGNIVKMSHGVKKHRGEFLRKLSENNLTNYEQFGGEIVKNGEFIDINILIK